MVTTKQKPKIDIQVVERKESKQTTSKYHQLTEKKSARKEERN